MVEYFGIEYNTVEILQAGVGSVGLMELGSLSGSCEYRVVLYSCVFSAYFIMHYVYFIYLLWLRERGLREWNYI